MSTGSASLIGQRLAAGRYQILDKLGEGGMGFVYRARDRNLDTDVVIKVPRLAVLESAAFAERFAQEVRSLVRLSHPHIVKVIDVGLHEGLPFAVMQCLGGGSLQSRRPRDKGGRFLPGDPHSLASWLTSVASALDFVHAQRYIHRDVKPGNILFDEHGNAYLSDFGVAKALAASSAQGHESASLTGTGMVLGTPHYMAPELVMDQPFDGRIDQYALAVTVYEVLTGRFPIEGTTPAAILVGQTTQPPRPLAELLPEAPAALGEALARALSKDPAGRFPTCTGFAKHVLAAVSQMPALPAGAPLPPAAEAAGVAADASTARDAAATTVPVGTVSRGEAGRVACPQCGRALPLSAKMAGRAIRCRPCGATCRVGPQFDELTLLAIGTVEPPRTGALSMAETSRIIETVGTAARRAPTGVHRAGGAQQSGQVPPDGGARTGDVPPPPQRAQPEAAKPRDLNKLVLVGVCTAAGVFAAGMLLLLAWSSMRPRELVRGDTTPPVSVEPGPMATTDESPEEISGNSDEHAADEGASGAPPAGDDSPGAGDGGGPGAAAFIPAVPPFASPEPSSVPELRWKLAVGDEFVQELVQELNADYTYHFDESIEVSHRWRRTTNFTWIVVGVDANGNSRIEARVDRVQFRLVALSDHPAAPVPTQEVYYDSVKPADSSAPWIEQVFDSVVGVAYTMTLSPQGEVLGMELPAGATEIESLTNHLQTPLEGYATAQMQRTFEQILLLPGDPRMTGGAWGMRQPVNIHPGAVRDWSVLVTSRHHRDGVPTVNASEPIQLPLEMRIDVRPEVLGALQVDIRQQRAGGMQLFDPRRGVVTSSNIEVILHMLLGLPKVPGAREGRLEVEANWLLTSSLDSVAPPRAGTVPGAAGTANSPAPPAVPAPPAAAPAPPAAPPAAPAAPFTRLELPSGAVLEARQFKVSEAELASYFPDDGTFYEDRDPAGNVRTVVTHQKGVLHGTAAAFHAPDQLSAVAPYRSGKRHGLLRLWTEDGSKQFLASYKNGNLDGIKCLFRDDRPWIVEEWTNASLRSRYLVQYSPEGQAQLIACYPESPEAAWQESVEEAIAALEAYEAELRKNEVVVVTSVKERWKAEWDAFQKQLVSERGRVIDEKNRQRQAEQAARNAAAMQENFRRAGGR